MQKLPLPPGFQDMLGFGLVEALLGRRSRRFFRGAEIPDGVFAYKSKHPPLPLSELEKLLVVLACGGNTNWHHLIYRAARYAPHLSNYCGAAGGRTFPSSAGFETSQTFFTDDEGVYLLDVRDGPALGERDQEGALNLEQLLAAHQGCIKKIRIGRLGLPPAVPYVEPHNTWVVNHPGTLLVIPVGDLSQHMLLNLCYLLQNGLVIIDDLNRRPVPGIEQFSPIVDVSRTFPLSFVEQWSLAELTAELSTSCYAGALMLQAMGLGGWMFNGLDPFAVLGASGDPEVPGLGFRYDTEERWPYPQVTGLPGVMEGFCPPHYADMRAAVEALCERKFCPGYVLVRMELNDATWHLVQNTPKVTGFLGPQGKPLPISDREAEQILKQVQEGIERPKPSITFEVGVQNLALAFAITFNILRRPDLAIAGLIYAAVMPATALAFVSIARRLLDKEDSAAAATGG